MKVVRVMLAFLLVTLGGCRTDETAIRVTPASQGITFEFRYIMEADQPVEVIGLIVQESKSEAIVWEIASVTFDEMEGGLGIKDKAGRKSYGKGISFSALILGNIPTGFKQVTPADQTEIQLRHGVKYRVLALTERGSGMTEFTLKGECRKISVTTFSKDLAEFKESKDC